MRSAISCTGCLAVATAMLAACDPASTTKPGITPTSRVSAGSAIVLVYGDTLRECPEVHIPELPCVPRDLPPSRR